MFFVRDRLFFGSISDAADILQKGTGEFTHVLSLLSSVSISFFSDWRADVSISTQEVRKVFAGEAAKNSLSPEKLMYALELAGPSLNIMRMAVPIRDTEHENLLDYLNICLDFIDQGRKEGGAILVHCFAGVSRSAAIIIAYLMRTEQISQEDALESLRQCCEFVCPNDGFLEQLKLFERMVFKVDTTSPLYKKFRLKILSYSHKVGEKVDSSIFEKDPGLPSEFSSSESAEQNQSKTAYRCKKCRRIVALHENIISHMPGEGEKCFEWHKRKSGNPFKRSDEVECSSIFIEPLRWMTTVEEGALEGKLTCIHCEARLGYFNWSGAQCSCGSWITPAFQLHKSKVDISSLSSSTVLIRDK